MSETSGPASPPAATAVTVQLFHTCLINELVPDVGMAVVRVLERLGCTVDVPLAQTCCGQPAFNAGFEDQARTAACHTIAVLETTTGPIIIPSGSCGDMIVHQFARVFGPESPWQARARAIAARCREFSDFVAERAGESRLGRLAGTTVAYHPSCHLSRGLGVDRQPRQLLARLEGVAIADVAADDECCGFGGLFAVKHGDISSRLLERKLDHLTAAGADRLVSCDMGCLLHLGGGLHRRESPLVVQHLAQLLDEAAR